MQNRSAALLATYVSGTKNKAVIEALQQECQGLLSWLSLVLFGLDRIDLTTQQSCLLKRQTVHDPYRHMVPTIPTGCVKQLNMSPWL